MPIIDLAQTDFGSLGENVNRVKLSNMYIVQNPLSLTGVSYIARPSLTTYATVNATKIRGIYYQSGQGSTTVYVVAGTRLYQLNSDASFTYLADIPGDDFCTFASTIYSMAIVSDGNLYIWDGTTLTPVVMPDSLLVSDVTSLDNYYIVGAKDTNKFYWIQPGDVTVDPLSFASAERNPDDIITMISLGDELWAIGQNSVEIFTDSGDANAPFVRTAGRAYQIGCADKHSIVRANKESLPCLIWVTPTKEVVLAQGIPAKISNESVEELLKKSANFVAWTFRTNRHDFYVLTTDNETLVYDITGGLWFRWSTYNKSTWDAYSGVQIDSTVYVVNQSGGTIYTLSDNPVDNTSDFIVCEVSGFIPNSTNNSVVCAAITLFMSYGYTPSYDDGPLVEMRWSDDGGSTYSTYYQGSLGKKGGYDTTVRYRSLGSFGRPGRYVEFRFSQISSFRLDGATLNDSV